MLRWVQQKRSGDRIIEREFRIDPPSRSVPGLIWTPDATTAKRPPVVLIGHGGSANKRSEAVVAMAHRFVAELGIAALAIDGPYHGDRVPEPMPASEYQRRNVREGIDAVIARMVEDWQATVDALAMARVLDSHQISYNGLSMGTRFGLPIAAALGERLRCLIIGKFGLELGSGIDPRLSDPRRVADAARAITAPTLFPPTVGRRTLPARRSVSAI